MEDATLYEYSTLTTTQALDPGAAAALAGFMVVMWLIGAILAVISIISLWKLFVKAGKPGWAALVPIYNIVVMLEIVGRPVWWVFLYFVPVVSLVASVIVTLDFAKSYGKDLVFGILMILFPVPMYPILAFSKSTQYVGPVVKPESPRTTAAQSAMPEAATPFQPKQ
jgi:hypothetical protein